MSLKTLLILFSFSLVVGHSFAQKEALSPRTANYDMKLTFDPTEKKINCDELLTWNNPSTDTIFELQFHIYQNAFKNTNSTFMRERGIFASMLATTLTECGWSWVDIKSIVDEHGNDLSAGMNYIQPDDNNESDQTVLSVPLPQPVMPNGSIQVRLNWESKIPLTMPRTGYNKSYFFMAQWFPKVGVYEPAGMRFAKKGQWNCHQYHSRGEYYSDFGVYNVDITAPADFILGTSGELIKETTEGGTKTSSFRAEDVIDFTWTASPHFVEINDQWKEVKIRTLLYPSHQHIAPRYIAAIKNSLEYFDKHLGKYPYPIITIVDPPIHGIFSAGMEYPTLITGLSSCLLPKGVKTVEILAVHEFTHQYFMQMVATHEVEEPFLDEGFTTYYEGRIMDHYYGQQTSAIDVLGVTVGNIELNRADFFGSDNPKIASNARRSWDFKDGGYGEISYNKTAVWLKTLEGMVGIETMDKIMQTYFQRWQFNHPCANDFIAIVNEIVRENNGTQFGENMNWFFDQVLYGTAICDYAVTSIEHYPTHQTGGYLDNNEDCISPEENDQTTSKVTIQRLGEMSLPVEILVQFEADDPITELWDGKDRSIRYKYTGKSKVVSAEIDPDRKIYIDKNFINNSSTAKANKKGIHKYLSQFMAWLQHAMLTFSMFV